MNTSIVNELTFASIEAGAGLARAVAMGRGDIIDQIGDSGLRGRGGAGFPVGVKWNLCAAAKSDRKYVVCNADEGEPGTFKDRVVLAEFAELVCEGMAIAGRAVGAGEGIVYLRAEYTYLVPHLEALLAELRQNHRLGRGIAGVDGFDFDIRIQLGAGAYVCGEETALIESLEGHRGEPRNRPPYPVDTGFCLRPTIVNNVEPLAWAACVLARGAQWFKSHGTQASTGRKLLSVSGDCARPGVYELPLGVTVAELLQEVGATDAKGVQVGGAAGIMVPPTEFERRLAFEDIATGGSIIVFGPGRDMLQVAHNFLEFFVEESCGQCTPCREGNAKLLEGVELLQAGRCSSDYLCELESLGETMQLASKCGLGQTSPNAFLSIVKHYRGEVMGRI